MPRLENGQTFPTLQLPQVGGGTLSLPDGLAGSFGVVLVYRGAWCPYCNAQLSAFRRASESLDAAGVKHVVYESPGTSHEWQTWRRSLHDFAPRLFRE